MPGSADLSGRWERSCSLGAAQQAMGPPAARERGLRPDERQAKHVHPGEHSSVAGGPIGAAVLSVAVENAEVAGGKDAVTMLLSYECRQIGNGAVGRGARDDPAATGRGMGRRPRWVHRDDHQGLAVGWGYRGGSQRAGSTDGELFVSW